MRILFISIGLFWFYVFPCLSQVSSMELIADIDQLESLIETRHIAPFRLVTKKKLKSIISKAKKEIASKKECDEFCYVELLKIVAALNDGHSVVKSKSREKLFGYLPVTTKWFKEGLYVTRVPEEYKQILGGHLKSINGVQIDDVLNKIREVLPHGNDSRFKKFAYAYLRMPGLLFGLGITESPGQANFMFSLNGEDTTIVFKNMEDEEYEKTIFISYEDISNTIPLYQKRSSDYYWDYYDSENKIFYFKYNRVGNMKTERASSYAERMWSKVDSLEVDKFILDIRNNGGGQFAFSMSFIQGILDRPKINVPGKLFIISGYDTFSAALDILRNLEVKSNAIIVGEAPGDYAASSGDPEPYTLKNSKIEVQLSSVFHPTVFKGDMRKEIILDKVIEPSWANYSRGEDAAFNYILDYKNQYENSVLTEKDQNYLGVYRYDEDKNISIKSVDGQLLMEISKSLRSPLYHDKKNRFFTEINGLTIEFVKKCIQVNFPDGQKEKFERTNVLKSGLDHLYEGNFEAAKVFYDKIKRDTPSNPLISDGRFSNLALFAFFELRKSNRVEASEIAKGILNLGIKLNDGEAPFCNFALKFTSALIT